MFDSYKDIFNQRGDLYHKAMTKFPMARIEEFAPLINLLEINKDDTVADIPSGGGYLRNYIDQDLTVYSIDSSQKFLKRQTTVSRTICAEISDIPLQSAFFNKIFSLAGIHYLVDKTPFFREAYRLLESGGIFGLADVESGSPVDPFLNVFVDEYNSMGHKGLFLDGSTIDELKLCNFDIVSADSIPCTWLFENKSEAIDFFKLLFCLDQANNRDIEGGINDYLGYQRVDGYFRVNWELFYIKAIKK